MRVRRFELRLIAVGLTVAWSAVAVLILLAYRPGGPFDLLVGVLGFLPILVSLAAVVWPPTARGDRAFAAIVWLGLGVGLVLVPWIGSTVNQLAARGTQTLLPSPEAAYPWVLALAGTSLFSGLGIARARLGEAALRRRRLVYGAVIAAGVTLITGTLFAGAAIGNDIALRDRPAVASRFGPTDPALELPACGGSIEAAPTARVELTLRGDVDGRSIGELSVSGDRNGNDLRWLANVATNRTLGLYGAARLGGRGWLLGPQTGWVSAPLSDLEDAGLDRRVLDIALTADNRAAAEFVGLEFVEGARARHCRIAIDGSTFRTAFPQVRWLAGDADLRHWRGELDYWIFGDGAVGQVSGSVNGEAAGLPTPGIQGTIHVRLTATDRGRAFTVPAPLP